MKLWYIKTAPFLFFPVSAVSSFLPPRLSNTQHLLVYYLNYFKEEVSSLFRDELIGSSKIGGIPKMSLVFAASKRNSK